MANKVLTDRVSVRVSVAQSNSSEKTKQDTATGRNIEKALGGSGLSDVDAETIGSNVDPVTDEDGNQWIKMEDIIAAGKSMKEKGAFLNTEVHEGILGNNGTLYNLTAYDSASITLLQRSRQYPDSSDPYYAFGNHYIKYSASGSSVYIAFIEGSGWAYAFSKESFSVSCQYYQKTSEFYPSADGGAGFNVYPVTSSINDVSYSYFCSQVALNDGYNWAGDVGNSGYVLNTIPDGASVNGCIAGFLFGATHMEPHSMINWDGTDEEIAQEIEKLHETWDITEHNGSTTLIYAGPIEFNDGD